MSKPSSPSLSEARAARRGRTLLGGKLVSENGEVTFDCVIRDLSEEGARVKLRSDLPVPDAVWLLNVAAGFAHRAEVRWSRGAEHGLRFTQTYDLRSPTPPPLPMRLRLIWLECAPR